MPLTKALLKVSILGNDLVPIGNLFQLLMVAGMKDLEWTWILVAGLSMSSLFLRGYGVVVPEPVQE